MSNIRDRSYAVKSHRCHCVGCCSVLVYFINLLIHLIGIGFVVFAVWLYLYNWDYVPIAPNNLYAKAVYWQFAYSVTVICSTLLSCFVVYKQNNARVICHLILALVICGCGVALTLNIYKNFKENFEGNISKTLRDAVIAEYSFTSEKTISIQRLHKKGNCCGAKDFEDWRDSLWWQSANNETAVLNGLYMNHVPDICCKTVVPACGRSDHPSNIYYEGCSKYLEKYFKVRFWSICTSMVVLSAAQLIGVMLEIFLSIELRRYAISVRQNTRYSSLLTNKSRHL